MSDQFHVGDIVRFSEKGRELYDGKIIEYEPLRIIKVFDLNMVKVESIETPGFNSVIGSQFIELDKDFRVKQIFDKYREEAESKITKTRRIPTS